MSRGKESRIAARMSRVKQSQRSMADNAAAEEVELPSVPWVDAVAKRYEPRKKLGDGMFGEVFKAWDRESERFVAVKRLWNRTDDDRFVRPPPRYFEQEVRSLEACHGHPCVVKLLDKYTDSRDNGDSFIITEYAGPMNLREYMNRRRKKPLDEDEVYAAFHEDGVYARPMNLHQYMNVEPFDEDEVRDIMEQLLAGARHAHKAGVLHRDIVPENVVVNWDAESARVVCKICGFGMSMPAAQADDGSGSLATPIQYRAPELELGSKDYNNRVDTYSLGCIMADLVAGDTEPIVEWEMLERPVPPARVTLMIQKDARQGLFLPEQMLLLSTAGFKVLKGLLDTNPHRRLSAGAALRKPWFPLTARIKHLCAA